MADTASSKKPVRTYRIGHISLVVWPNEYKTKDGKEFSSRTYRLTRTYKDSNGEFQETDSLQVPDLLIAAALYNMAWQDDRATFVKE